MSRGEGRTAKRGVARRKKTAAKREPRAKARKAKPASASDPGSEVIHMLNVGHGNLVLASRIVAIVAPGASPMRRLRDEAVNRNKLVDATMGRRTRSILVTDSDHVILSAVSPETIAQRLEPGHEAARGASA